MSTISVLLHSALAGWERKTRGEGGQRAGRGQVGTLHWSGNGETEWC